MPIPLPNLDDRSYADLITEAQALIPSLYPEWTNHNPSDPGIVLTELLAWLTEMLLYQVNEVPDQNVQTFLGLLGWSNPRDQSSVDLTVAVRDTLRGLRRQYRAVTGEDFERLALEQWPATEAAKLLGDNGKIKRVRCVPRRNLAAADPREKDSAAPAHVSVVIIADTANPYEGVSEPLREALHAFFKERCLLTSRHHIVGPDYIPVQVSATLFVREDAPPEATLNEAIEVLYSFFDPLRGGSEQTGWPFGRDVYASEIYAIFDNMPLVDSVEGVNLKVPAHPDRLQIDGDTLVGVTLDDHELVAIEVTGLVAIDADGHEYAPDIIGVIGYQPLA